MIVSVNDASVMDAWKKDQGLAGSDVTIFVADVQAQLTDALGIHLTGADKAGTYPDFCTGGGGPNFALGMHTKRCKRAAFYVEDGIIKAQQISEGGPEGQFDPAGDNFPETSCIENMLKLIKEGMPAGLTGSTKK